MTSEIAVKICGISQIEELQVLSKAGCRYCGFVFFEKSPRNVTFETASALAQEAPVGLAKVALTVNANNAFLDELVAKVPLDMLQLHGSEAPERVLEIKARYGLAVMKAVGVVDASDLPMIDTYMQVADQILVDAKPSTNAQLPGGNGLQFDWRLISGRRWSVPWMLAGGLTPENVGQAIKMTGAKQVDVSSGVEFAPGKKDLQLITEFAKVAMGSV